MNQIQSIATPKLSGDRCKCRSCGSYFNSTAAFDKHRSGSYGKDKRRCLTFMEMSDRGMVVNQAGYWVSKIRPKYQ